MLVCFFWVLTMCVNYFCLPWVISVGRLGLLLTALLLGHLGLTTVLQAQPKVVSENQLKAVLLFNFVRYTYWPDVVFNDNDSPYTICFYGENTFTVELERTIHGETVRKRALALRNLDDLDQLTDCQIIYVGQADESSERDVLSRSKAYPILTMGEKDGFVPNGGMVGFVKKSNSKMGFEVNPEAVSDARLRISANLLQLAKIIHQRR